MLRKTLLVLGRRPAVTACGLDENYRALSGHRQYLLYWHGPFFIPEARNVPAYLLQEPRNGGGLAPQIDNSSEGQAKKHRQGGNAVECSGAPAMLNALAKDFDAEVYGINLPEIAIDIVEKPLPSGYSCDAYFQAEIENIAEARNVFKKVLWCSTLILGTVNGTTTTVIWRVFLNIRMSHVHDIGLGGPDLTTSRPSENLSQTHKTISAWEK